MVLGWRPWATRSLLPQGHKSISATLDAARIKPDTDRQQMPAYGTRGLKSELARQVPASNCPLALAGVVAVQDVSRARASAPGARRPDSAGAPSLDTRIELDVPPPNRRHPVRRPTQGLLPDRVSHER